MVERVNGLMVAKEMERSFRLMSNTSSPFSIRLRHQQVMECFRKVWPVKEGGNPKSRWYHEDWESWGLQVD